MSLTFMNFKQVIPAPILKRGRDYWQRSYISELEYDEEDACWEAQVAGTELYEVRVERQPDGTLACSCTCPYEAGEHCKHIAAVLYAIEETFPELLNSELRKPAPARPLKRDHLRQLLENAPRQTLIDILLDLTRRDRELRNQLLIQLDPENAGTSAYRRIVRDMLRAGRGHDNFLDYRGASQAGRKVQQMCVQAQGWAAAGEVARAVAFYQAVIEEVIAAMGHADDSNGELGAGISMALEGLAENISLLDASEGEALFNYCIAQARSEMMNGWDWQWELIDIAVSQAHSAERVAALTAALDEMEAKVAQEPDDRFSRSYALEYIVTYKAELIERFDGRQAARDFLKTYMSLDKVRMDFIEEYLQEGRLDEAVQLIQEGIASSERRRLAGLTQQYRAF